MSFRASSLHADGAFSVGTRRGACPLSADDVRSTLCEYSQCHRATCCQSPSQRLQGARVCDVGWTALPSATSLLESSVLSLFCKQVPVRDSVVNGSECAGEAAGGGVAALPLS